MTIRDLTGTEFLTSEVPLASADLRDTYNSKLGFNYYSGAANSVQSGLAITGTAAQTVDISAGYFVGSTGKTLYEAANSGVALSAAEVAGNPRIDLISITDAGVITVTDGTAAADPTCPSLPADDTLLGCVYRATDDNTTLTNDITDLRTFWGSNGKDRIYRRHINDLNASAINGYVQFFPTVYENTYTKFEFVLRGRHASADDYTIHLTQGFNDAGGNADYATILSATNGNNTTVNETRAYDADYIVLVAVTGDDTNLVWNIDGSFSFPFAGDDSGNYQLIINGVYGGKIVRATQKHMVSMTGYSEDTFAAIPNGVQFKMPGVTYEEFELVVYGIRDV